MRRNVLEVKDLVRNYRKSVIKESEEDVKVLKGINFQVAEGEFVGIMGKSGCGKTTLLKTLGMIDKPTDGTIKFMGEDTSELYGDKLADIRNSKIGFIFQDSNLVEFLNVQDNILLPISLVNGDINKEKYTYLLETLRISKLVGKYPNTLSGGEKQKIACAGVSIMEPDVLVMDEFMAAYNYGLIPNEDAITFLKEKPERMEIVLTGRNPDERLIELADYVSEIKKRKHPFDRGIYARKGIEY